MKTIFPLLCLAIITVNGQPTQITFLSSSQIGNPIQRTDLQYDNKQIYYLPNSTTSVKSYFPIDSLFIKYLAEYKILQSSNSFTATGFNYQNNWTEHQFLSESKDLNAYTLTHSNSLSLNVAKDQPKLFATSYDNSVDPVFEWQTIQPNLITRVYNLSNQTIEPYINSNDNGFKTFNAYYQPNTIVTNYDYLITKNSPLNEVLLNNGRRIGMTYKRDELVTNNGTTYDIMTANVSNSINPYLRASVSNGISLIYEASYKWELTGTDYKPWLYAQVNNDAHLGTSLTINTQANLSDKNGIGAFEITNSRNTFLFGTTSFTNGMIGFKKWEETSLNIQSGTLNVLGSMNVMGQIKTSNFKISDEDGRLNFDISPTSFIIGGGIGHPSAIFVFNSRSQGVLLTRMTSHERKSIKNPETGLEVFDTDQKKKMFFNGQEWEILYSTPFDRPFNSNN